jgi:hypothetical protein
MVLAGGSATPKSQSLLFFFFVGGGQATPKGQGVASATPNLSIVVVGHHLGWLATPTSFKFFFFLKNFIII